jgi:zinc transporter ZupT
MTSVNIVLAIAEESLSKPDTSPLAVIFAIGLALAHLFSGKLRFLHSIPRSRWLSIAGGVSVAYVFVHIFPELSEGQEELEQTGRFAIGFLEHHVYLVALIGFTIFYGLERIAKASRQRQRKAGEGDKTSSDIFWLHIASFAIYNALIGYLLVHREDGGFFNLLFFSLAMALHFIVNDDGLREHHKSVYDKIGRWILVGAIILGWVIGEATELPQAAIAVLFAFLAGGIILNVLKEELPEDRESRFWAFALGAGGYALLLLTL